MADIPDEIYAAGKELIEQYESLREGGALPAELEAVELQLRFRLRMRLPDTADRLERIDAFVERLQRYPEPSSPADEFALSDVGSSAERFAQMLRKDIGARSLENIASELHIKWGNQNPFTTRSYIDGYLLCPPQLERVLLSSNWDEHRMLRERAESLIRHLDGDWPAYARLLNEVRPEFVKE